MDKGNTNLCKALFNGSYSSYIARLILWGLVFLIAASTTLQASEVNIGGGAVFMRFKGLPVPLEIPDTTLLGLALRISGELLYFGFDLDLIPFVRIKALGQDMNAILFMPYFKIFYRVNIIVMSLGITNPVLILDPGLRFLPASIGAYAILPITTVKYGMRLFAGPISFFTDIGLNFMSIAGPASLSAFPSVVLGIMLNF